MSELSGMNIGPAAVEHYDYTLFGPVETHALSRLRRLVAQRMAASWREVPHVTHFDAVDVTDLEARRRKAAEIRGPQSSTPSLLSHLVWAVSKTLGRFPDFNASLDSDGKTLHRKAYRNIGIAVDTPAGLLVPVLHNVQDMGVAAIADGIAALAGRARSGNLKNEDVEGGSFTVTSLGRLGGSGFTPIINAPEVAILGVSRIQETPAVRDGSIVVRRLLPLSLSYDHRVIDGAAAGRFMAALAEQLSSGP